MSEIKVDTLTGKTTANDITVTVGASATQSLEQGLAKAWFIYDQTTTTTLDSLNTSSITDRATGSMYGNFTNSMSSTYYATTMVSTPAAIGSMGTSNYNRQYISSPDTTSRLSSNVFTITSATGSDERANQSITIGDLA